LGTAANVREASVGAAGPGRRRLPGAV